MMRMMTMNLEVASGVGIVRLAVIMMMTRMNLEVASGVGIATSAVMMRKLKKRRIMTRKRKMPLLTRRNSKLMW